MMEWKVIGISMIIPTLALAVYLVIKTFHHNELFINAAVLCWIMANSYWMVVEFYFNETYIHFAAIPFILGFVFVAIYYLKPGKRTSDGQIGGFPGGEA